MTKREFAKQVLKEMDSLYKEYIEYSPKELETKGISYEESGISPRKLATFCIIAAAGASNTQLELIIRIGQLRGNFVRAVGAEGKTEVSDIGKAVQDALKDKEDLG